MTPYPPLWLGQLDANPINRTLRKSLPNAPVFMSASAHQHAAEKHPADYAACFPLLQQAIHRPTFIGQGKDYLDNIQLVLSDPSLETASMLAAMSIVLDNRGRYRVRSFYQITERLVWERRRQGVLLVPKA